MGLIGGETQLRTEVRREWLGLTGTVYPVATAMQRMAERRQ